MDISRFRHVRSHLARADNQFLNFYSSEVLWEGSNTIACNGIFVAAPSQQSGGTSIFKHTDCGRVSGDAPILKGHGGAIMDIKFNPFNDNQVFTADEEGNIKGWFIPDSGLPESASDPLICLRGHTRKCGVLAFHPSASGVLASAGTDKVINVWDTEKEVPRVVLDAFNDYSTGLDWNLDGSLLCTVNKDRKLVILDPRAKNATAAEQESHSSSRAQRCVWAKRKNRIITLGRDSSQRKEIKVWDTAQLSRPSSCFVMDNSSAAVMPIFDEDLSLLFVGSRGRNGFSCYEFTDHIIPGFDVPTPEPLKGICAFPKYSLDAFKCEIARVYHLGKSALSSVELVVPRRQSESRLQDDLYPSTFSKTPPLSAGLYFEGKSMPPNELDLQRFFLEGQQDKFDPDTTAVTSAVGDMKNSVSKATVHVDSTLAISDTQSKNDTQRKLSGLITRFARLKEEIEVRRAELCAKENDLLSTIKEIEALHLQNE